MLNLPNNKVTPPVTAPSSLIEQTILPNVLGSGNGQTGQGLVKTGSNSNESLTGGQGNDTLYGLGGNDYLRGAQGNDLLEGGDGDDRLLGQQGNNTLLGGSGHDWLEGDKLGDRLDGGVGNDTMTGKEGSDTYVVDSVLDKIVEKVSGGFDWVEASLSYTLGANLEYLTLTGKGHWAGVGNNSANKIVGNAGNNLLQGRNGNDTLEGQAGDDTLEGGDGNDTYLFASPAGHDEVVDTAGMDVANFNALTQGMVIDFGQDVVIADSGNSVMTGATILEDVRAGQGADILFGSAQADVMKGMQGHDSLDGQAGNDTLDGGTGNDTYRFTGVFGNDTITDADGLDTLDLSQIQSYVAVNLDSAQVLVNNGANGTVSIFNAVVENVIAGNANNSLQGNAAQNVLTAGTGNDILRGRDGNDTLTGGKGSDSIEGNGGNDFLDGGEGNNDRYIFENAWGVDTLADAAGIDDKIEFNTVTSHLTIQLTSGAGAEVSDGLNTIDIVGDAIEYAYAGSGNDWISGNANANTILGRQGADTIYGGAGGDNLNGGAGNDLLDGGLAVDKFVFDNDWGQDTIQDTDGSNSLEAATVQTDVTLDGRVKNGVLMTDGIRNTVTVQVTGDWVTLISGLGNDTVWGNAQSNFISTNAGHDTLWAGDGNDTILTGLGNDMAFGEAGDDTYRLVNTWGTDTLVDTTGTDTVDLSTVNTHLTVQLVSAVDALEVTDGSNSLDWENNSIENILTGSGNDSIKGSQVANVITAGAGNDGVWAGDGNDRLIETEANGSDTLNGEAGIDVVTYDDNKTTSHVTLVLGSDTAIRGGQTDTLLSIEQVLGTDHLQDTLDLSSDTDGLSVSFVTGVISGVNSTVTSVFQFENIVGGSGHDSITGNSAANVLAGGSGQDSLDGQAGNDRYDFADGFGNDSIVDTAGLDTIDLSAATQAVVVNLTSSAGAEVVLGANTVHWQNSVIENATGGSANDTLQGNAQANVLNGSGGNDTLQGAAGSDTYVFTENWGLDVIDDVAGTDTLDVSALQLALSIDLRTEQVHYQGQQILWAGSTLENVITGNATDTVQGNGADNQLTSNNGDDALQGFAGNDTLKGGLDNDTLWGGEGDDSLDGGNGNDVYVVENAWGNDVIVDTAGTDLLNAEAVSQALSINLVSSAGHEVTMGANNLNWDAHAIERVWLGSGNDVVVGSALDNDITDRMGGNNTLYGGAGHDKITSSAGDDSLFGEAGHDTLNGGSGNDVLNGGSGSDVYVFNQNWGQDSIIDTDWSAYNPLDALTAPIDTVDLSNITTNLTIQLKSGSTAEVSDGSNRVDWENSVIENALSGSGNDVIWGNRFSNRLSGGLGNDWIDAGNGNDRLDNITGRDTLLGGNGNDTYTQFNGQFEALIQDASGQRDGIDLSQYRLSNVSSWTALDGADADRNVDSLTLLFTDGNTLRIDNYFSNTNRDDDKSLAGSGHIESIQFADDTVDFTQALSLVN